MFMGLHAMGAVSGELTSLAFGGTATSYEWIHVLRVVDRC